MNQAFVIMQIGNKELDRVYEQVMFPALKACGLDPKRVDKHNKGGLLKSEIIEFTKNSEIIVADLTNERPNCYLEVGYTMGVNKFSNLILTAREDHNPSSKNHKPGGPIVHFDLAGYDILFWDPSELGEYRAELEKRIRRRRAIVVADTRPRSLWNEDWVIERQSLAKAELQKTGYSACMEVRYSLHETISKTRKELLAAAGASQIQTFHWPIGIVVPTNEGRPKPTSDGIVAQSTLDFLGTAFDNWILKSNGDFYLLENLYEDMMKPPNANANTHSPGAIFFNAQIARITEVLLHCVLLYSKLGVSGSTAIQVGIRHTGLTGRWLLGNQNSHSWATHILPFRGPSNTDAVASENNLPLNEVESSLIQNVKEFAEPLFTLFDYYELDDAVYSRIVTEFVQGKIT